MLERPIETVIDVGCGEGPWRAALRRIRPKARYVGLDPSEYAIRRLLGDTRSEELRRRGAAMDFHDAMSIALAELDRVIAGG